MMLTKQVGALRVWYKIIVQNLGNPYYTFEKDQPCDKHWWGIFCEAPVVFDTYAKGCKSGNYGYNMIDGHKLAAQGIASCSCVNQWLDCVGIGKANNMLSSLDKTEKITSIIANVAPTTTILACAGGVCCSMLLVSLCCLINKNSCLRKKIRERIRF